MTQPNCYTPGIYAEGYIVFACPFVCLFVCFSTFFLLWKQPMQIVGQKWLRLVTLTCRS